MHQLQIRKIVDEDLVLQRYHNPVSPQLHISHLPNTASSGSATPPFHMMTCTSLHRKYAGLSDHACKGILEVLSESLLKKPEAL